MGEEHFEGLRAGRSLLYVSLAGHDELEEVFHEGRDLERAERGRHEVMPSGARRIW